jgi:putative FmdB family regulatory protein
MPIYDFKCADCNVVSEILVRTTNGESPHCPECGSMNLEKLVSSSYMIKMGASEHGRTCCGRTERCDTPRCAADGNCARE